MAEVTIVSRRRARSASPVDASALAEGFAARVMSYLTHHERMALRLRHGQGMEPPEIAARMHLPQGVVERLLADADRTLQAARRALVGALAEAAPERTA